MRIHLAFGIWHLELPRGGSKRRAFTLLELLVVIGIIAVLASILFPVISKVREAARETDTKALINSIEGACQAYHQDFNAYPGPLSNSYVTAEDQVNFGIAPPMWRNSDTGIGIAASGTTPANPNGFNDAKVGIDGVVEDGARVTAAENLVLGLLGGVSVNKSQQNNFYLEFDPAAVGTGAALLNPVRSGRAGTYIQLSSLSKGKFVDDNGLNQVTSKDSMIPEFVDRFQQPMPILVMRSRTGGRAASQTQPNLYDEKNNDVVVNLPSSVAASVNGQFNLVDITPYTQSMIGAPRNLKQSAYVPIFDATKPHGLATVDVTKGMNKSAPAEYVYPYDGFSYLADPASYTMTDIAATKKSKMKPRKQDQMIFISAGRDRVYGTDDDVTNFGSVRP